MDIKNTGCWFFSQCYFLYSVTIINVKVSIATMRLYTCVCLLLNLSPRKTFHIHNSTKILMLINLQMVIGTISEEPATKELITTVDPISSQSGKAIHSQIATVSEYEHLQWTAWSKHNMDKAYYSRYWDAVDARTARPVNTFNKPYVTDSKSSEIYLNTKESKNLPVTKPEPGKHNFHQTKKRQSKISGLQDEMESSSLHLSKVSEKITKTFSSKLIFTHANDVVYKNSQFNLKVSELNTPSILNENVSSHKSSNFTSRNSDFLDQHISSSKARKTVSTISVLTSKNGVTLKPEVMHRHRLNSMVDSVFSSTASSFISATNNIWDSEDKTGQSTNKNVEVKSDTAEITSTEKKYKEKGTAFVLSSSAAIESSTIAQTVEQISTHFSKKNGLGVHSKQNSLYLQTHLTTEMQSKSSTVKDKLELFPSFELAPTNARDTSHTRVIANTLTELPVSLSNSEYTLNEMRKNVYSDTNLKIKKTEDKESCNNLRKQPLTTKANVKFDLSDYSDKTEEDNSVTVKQNNSITKSQIPDGLYQELFYQEQIASVSTKLESLHATLTNLGNDSIMSSTVVIPVYNANITRLILIDSTGSKTDNLFVNEAKQSENATDISKDSILKELLKPLHVPQSTESMWDSSQNEVFPSNLKSPSSALPRRGSSNMSVGGRHITSTPKTNQASTKINDSDIDIFNISSKTINILTPAGLQSSSQSIYSFSLTADSNRHNKDSYNSAADSFTLLFRQSTGLSIENNYIPDVQESIHLLVKSHELLQPSISVWTPAKSLMTEETHTKQMKNWHSSTEITMHSSSLKQVVSDTITEFIPISESLKISASSIPRSELKHFNMLQLISPSKVFSNFESIHKSFPTSKHEPALQDTTKETSKITINLKLFKNSFATTGPIRSISVPTDAIPVHEFPSKTKQAYSSKKVLSSLPSNIYRQTFPAKLKPTSFSTSKQIKTAFSQSKLHPGILKDCDTTSANFAELKIISSTLAKTTLTSTAYSIAQTSSANIHDIEALHSPELTSRKASVIVYPRGSASKRAHSLHTLELTIASTSASVAGIQPMLTIVSDSLIIPAPVVTKKLTLSSVYESEATYAPKASRELTSSTSALEITSIPEDATELSYSAPEPVLVLKTELSHLSKSALKAKSVNKPNTELTQSSVPLSKRRSAPIQISKTAEAYESTLAATTPSVHLTKQMSSSISALEVISLSEVTEEWTLTSAAEPEATPGPEATITLTSSSIYESRATSTWKEIQTSISNSERTLVLITTTEPKSSYPFASEAKQTPEIRSLTSESETSGAQAPERIRELNPSATSESESKQASIAVAETTSAELSIIEPTSVTPASKATSEPVLARNPTLIYASRSATTSASETTTDLTPLNLSEANPVLLSLKFFMQTSSSNSKVTAPEAAMTLRSSIPKERVIFSPEISAKEKATPSSKITGKLAISSSFAFAYTTASKQMSTIVAASEKTSVTSKISALTPETSTSSKVPLRHSPQSSPTSKSASESKQTLEHAIITEIKLLPTSASGTEPISTQTANLPNESESTFASLSEATSALVFTELRMKSVSLLEATSVAESATVHIPPKTIQAPFTKVKTASLPFSATKITSALISASETIIQHVTKTEQILTRVTAPELNLALASTQDFLSASASVTKAISPKTVLKTKSKPATTEKPGQEAKPEDTSVPITGLETMPELKMLTKLTSASANISQATPPDRPVSDIEISASDVLESPSATISLKYITISMISGAYDILAPAATEELKLSSISASESKLISVALPKLLPIPISLTSTSSKLAITETTKKPVFPSRTISKPLSLMTLLPESISASQATLAATGTNDQIYSYSSGPQSVSVGLSKLTSDSKSASEATSEEIKAFLTVSEKTTVSIADINFSTTSSSEEISAEELLVASITASEKSLALTVSETTPATSVRPACLFLSETPVAPVNKLEVEITSTATFQSKSLVAYEATIESSLSPSSPSESRLIPFLTTPMILIPALISKSTSVIESKEVFAPSVTIESEAILPSSLISELRKPPFPLADLTTNSMTETNVKQTYISVSEATSLPEATILLKSVYESEMTSALKFTPFSTSSSEAIPAHVSNTGVLQACKTESEDASPCRATTKLKLLFGSSIAPVSTAHIKHTPALNLDASSASKSTNELVLSKARQAPLTTSRTTTTTPLDATELRPALIPAPETTLTPRSAIDLMPASFSPSKYSQVLITMQESLPVPVFSSEATVILVPTIKSTSTEQQGIVDIEEQISTPISISESMPVFEQSNFTSISLIISEAILASEHTSEITQPFLYASKSPKAPNSIKPPTPSVISESNDKLVHVTISEPSLALGSKLTPVTLPELRPSFISPLFVAITDLELTQVSKSGTTPVTVPWADLTQVSISVSELSSTTIGTMDQINLYALGQQITSTSTSKFAPEATQETGAVKNLMMKSVYESEEKLTTVPTLTATLTSLPISEAIPFATQNLTTASVSAAEATNTLEGTQEATSASLFNSVAASTNLSKIKSTPTPFATGEYTISYISATEATSASVALTALTPASPSISATASNVHIFELNNSTVTIIQTAISVKPAIESKSASEYTSEPAPAFPYVSEAPQTVITVKPLTTSNVSSSKSLINGLALIPSPVLSQKSKPTPAPLSELTSLLTHAPKATSVPGARKGLTTSYISASQAKFDFVVTTQASILGTEDTSLIVATTTPTTVSISASESMPVPVHTLTTVPVSAPETTLKLATTPHIKPSGISTSKAISTSIIDASLYAYASEEPSASEASVTQASISEAESISDLTQTYVSASKSKPTPGAIQVLTVKMQSSAKESTTSVPTAELTMTFVAKSESKPTALAPNELISVSISVSNINIKSKPTPAFSPELTSLPTHAPIATSAPGGMKEFATSHISALIENSAFAVTTALIPIPLSGAEEMSVIVASTTSTPISISASESIPISVHTLTSAAETKLKLATRPYIETSVISTSKTISRLVAETDASLYIFASEKPSASVASITQAYMSESDTLSKPKQTYISTSISISVSDSNIKSNPTPAFSSELTSLLTHTPIATSAPGHMNEFTTSYISASQAESAFAVTTPLTPAPVSDGKEMSVIAATTSLMPKSLSASKSIPTSVHTLKSVSVSASETTIQLGTTPHIKPSGISTSSTISTFEAQTDPSLYILASEESSAFLTRAIMSESEAISALIQTYVPASKSKPTPAAIQELTVKMPSSSKESTTTEAITKFIMTFVAKSETELVPLASTELTSVSISVSNININSKPTPTLSPELTSLPTHAPIATSAPGGIKDLTTSYVSASQANFAFAVTTVLTPVSISGAEEMSVIAARTTSTPVSISTPESIPITVPTLTSVSVFAPETTLKPATTPQIEPSMIFTSKATSALVAATGASSNTFASEESSASVASKTQAYMSESDALSVPTQTYILASKSRIYKAMSESDALSKPIQTYISASKSKPTPWAIQELTLEIPSSSKESTTSVPKSETKPVSFPRTELTSVPISVLAFTSEDTDTSELPPASTPDAMSLFVSTMDLTPAVASVPKPTSLLKAKIITSLSESKETPATANIPKSIPELVKHTFVVPKALSSVASFASETISTAKPTLAFAFSFETRSVTPANVAPSEFMSMPANALGPTIKSRLKELLASITIPKPKSSKVVLEPTPITLSVLKLTTAANPSSDSTSAMDDILDLTPANLYSPNLMQTTLDTANDPLTRLNKLSVLGNCTSNKYALKSSTPYNILASFIDNSQQYLQRVTKPVMSSLSSLTSSSSLVLPFKTFVGGIPMINLATSSIFSLQTWIFKSTPTQLIQPSISVSWQEESSFLSTSRMIEEEETYNAPSSMLKIPKESLSLDNLPVNIPMTTTDTYLSSKQSIKSVNMMSPFKSSIISITSPYLFSTSKTDLLSEHDFILPSIQDSTLLPSTRIFLDTKKLPIKTTIITTYQSRSLNDLHKTLSAAQIQPPFLSQASSNTYYSPAKRRNFKPTFSTLSLKTEEHISFQTNTVANSEKLINTFSMSEPETSWHVFTSFQNTREKSVLQTSLHSKYEKSSLQISKKIKNKLQPTKTIPVTLNKETKSNDLSLVLLNSQETSSIKEIYSTSIRVQVSKALITNSFKLDSTQTTSSSSASTSSSLSSSSSTITLFPKKQIIDNTIMIPNINATFHKIFESSKLYELTSSPGIKGITLIPVSSMQISILPTKHSIQLTSGIKENTKLHHTGTSILTSLENVFPLWKSTELSSTLINKQLSPSDGRQVLKSPEFFSKPIISIEHHPSQSSRTLHVLAIPSSSDEAPLDPDNLSKALQLMSTSRDSNLTLIIKQTAQPVSKELISPTVTMETSADTSNQISKHNSTEILPDKHAIQSSFSSTDEYPALVASDRLLSTEPLPSAAGRILAMVSSYNVSEQLLSTALLSQEEERRSESVSITGEPERHLNKSTQQHYLQILESVILKEENAVPMQTISVSHSSYLKQETALHTSLDKVLPITNLLVKQLISETSSAAQVTSTPNGSSAISKTTGQSSTDISSSKHVPRLSKTATITTASMYPYYGVVNLLSVGIKVKLNIDIKTVSFKENIVEGLQACYNEGLTYMQMNQQNNVEGIGGLAARQKRAASGKTEITNMERLYGNPEKVDIVFYVRQDGVPLPSSQSVLVFALLSDVEISALLRYPIYRPVSKMVTFLSTTTPSTDSSTDLTFILVAVPIAAFALAAIIVAAFYCYKRRNVDDLATSFWRKYKSLSLRKPTLDELDLAIDVERGEIVNKISDGYDSSLPPYRFNTQSMDINNDINLYETLDNNHDKKGKRIIVTKETDKISALKQTNLQKFRGRTKDITRQHQSGNSKSINNVYNQESPKFSITQNISFESDTMRISDSPDDFDELHMSMDSRSNTFSSTDYENDDASVILAASSKELVDNILEVENHFDDFTYENTAHRDRMKSNRSKYKVVNSGKYELNTDHRDLPRYGILSDDQNKLKKVLPSNIAYQLKSLNERDNIKEPHKGICNPFVEKKSKDLQKEPYGSNCDKAASKYISRYPVSEDVIRISNNKMGLNTGKNIHTEGRYGDVCTVRQSMQKQRAKDKTTAGLDEQNHIPGIRNDLYDNEDTKTSEEVRNTCSSSRCLSDQTSRAKVLDGSVFAGNEFETLTCPTPHTHSTTEHIYEPVYGELEQQYTMGEMINADVHPGVFEHVTKMGRIGGNKQSVNRSRAQFRTIGFQGMVPPGSPEPASSLATSLSATPSRVRTVNPPLVEERQHETPRTRVYEQQQSREVFHYEEMRLGRNMRAAPRGFSSQMADSTAPDSDVSEPLLNLSTNQPSNVVVDYLASTHPASVRQSTTTTSAMFSARTITSPQHPSQHLIEMLNRHQHYSSQLRDLEQEQADEREQRELQQEREERERVDVAAAQRHQAVIDARYEEEILRQEKLVDVPFTNGAGTENNDTHRDTLGLTIGTLSSTQTKEPSEPASTQPFSPKASASIDFTGFAMATSSSSWTRSQAISVERSEVVRQETSEDVNEIEEDIIDDVEGGKGDESDDGFNF